MIIHITSNWSYSTIYFIYVKFLPTYNPLFSMKDLVLNLLFQSLILLMIQIIKNPLQIMYKKKQVLYYKANDMNDLLKWIIDIVADERIFLQIS